MLIACTYNAHGSQLSSDSGTTTISTGCVGDKTVHAGGAGWSWPENSVAEAP